MTSEINQCLMFVPTIRWMMEYVIATEHEKNLFFRWKIYRNLVCFKNKRTYSCSLNGHTIPASFLSSSYTSAVGKDTLRPFFLLDRLNKLYKKKKNFPWGGRSWVSPQSGNDRRFMHETSYVTLEVRR